MTTTAEQTIALGSTGLTQYNGRIQEEYLRELQGSRWFRVVRQMQDDATIGAGLLAIELLLRQVTWDIVPASEDAPAVDAADFTLSCWSDMAETWPDRLSEILSFLPYGWVALEVGYKERRGLVFRLDGSEDAERSSKFTDGKTGWACWSPRAQDTLDRWEFGEDGSVRGLWQIAPPSYQSVFLPIEKLLHLKTTSTKGNPEGRSLLRRAYRPWYFKRNIENIEGVGIERDLAGLPVIRVPESVILAGGATYDAWKRMARNIKRDEQEGIVLSSGKDASGNYHYDVQLLTTGGRRQFDTDAVITRYDSRIAMAMLCDVLLMGHDKVGSFALSSNKTELLGVALGAFLETIALGIQGQLFSRLLRLNGVDQTLSPTLAHGDIETADLEALGNYLGKLTDAGMKIFPNPDLETYLLEQAGLPVPEGGYPPVEEPAAPPPEEDTRPVVPAPTEEQPA
jgi:hypothetical protein